MADAEAGEVRHQRHRIVQGKTLMELQSQGGPQRLRWQACSLVTLSRLKPRAGKQFQASRGVRVVQQGLAVARQAS